jgi:hypothetical protein
MRVAYAVLLAALVSAWSPSVARAAGTTAADLGGWSVSFAPSAAAVAAPTLHAWPTLWETDVDALASGMPARDVPAPRRLAVTAFVRPAVANPAIQGSAPPPKAFEYSDAYVFRRKIHYIASFATLPLFATEYILGEKLYDGDAGSGTRDAHAAVAASLGALFGVNTITGVWNAWEARKDRNGRGKRILHSVLMLAADAGFVATGALAPDSEDGNYLDDRGTHRNVALVSMGTATVGYLIMLFGR